MNEYQWHPCINWKISVLSALRCVSEVERLISLSIKLNSKEILKIIIKRIEEKCTAAGFKITK